MRSYGAARGLLSFLGFLAWCAIILGIFIAIGAGSAVSQSRSFGIGNGAMAGVLAAMPGLILAFLGFLALVLVQMGRAGVDTAEYTQQMLKIARDQLEVSKQGLKHGSAPSQSFEGLEKENPSENVSAVDATFEKTAAPAKNEPAITTPPKGYGPGDQITYRTKTIRSVEAGFVVGGQIYSSLEKAKAKIDEEGHSLPPEPQLTRPKPDPVAVDPLELSASFKRS